MKKLLVLIVLAASAGGAYFVIYTQAQTELTLAELKSDLDGMYSPLQTLAMLQIPSAKRHLPQVAAAITLREDMLRNAADNDHELAVISAGKLLEIVPNHRDGTRILKESGQILLLLRDARNTVEATLSSDSPSSAPYEKVYFEQSSSTTSKELITFVQKGLSELGHYHSVVDGIAGPGTTKALDSFNKSRGINLPLDLSNETANLIIAEIALEKAKEKWQQSRFHGLYRAHELANGAVELDPHFDRATTMVEDLDRAHEAFAIVLGASVLEQGQSVFSAAATLHDSTVSTLTAAVSYGIVSEMYAKLKPGLDKAGRLLDSMQEEIDESMKSISSYKGKRSREFFESIKEFVHVVRTGTDTLLVPTGNINDYRQAGNEVLREYKRALSRVQASLPDSATLDETISGLRNVFANYVIFSDPKTEQIIENNLDLYTM